MPPLPMLLCIFCVSVCVLCVQESASFPELNVYLFQFCSKGCSDARVSPNVLMGEDAGSVFTVRNVANMVIGTDFNLMSALQYAVGVLKIPHIIVCGHYDCGGVRASIENKDHVPPLENWLRNIRDVYRLHRKELDAIKDPESRHRRLVELNVVEQCINLFKTGAIQRRRVETFQDSESPFTTPRIHACVFDPKDGRLRRLNVDFREYINELHDIYDLYEPDRVENSENLPDYISKQVAFNIDEECVLVPPNAPTPVAGGLETECASPPVTMLDEKEEIKEINGKSKSKNILKRAWKKVTN
mmetsp:Transcript_10993/g.24222  ORF Transcript_10993/g.24222 Transcript_10993/m.24222 type:complete len:301 (-) Transcript_10993:26-928(-)